MEKIQKHRDRWWIYMKYEDYILTTILKNDYKTIAEEMTMLLEQFDLEPDRLYLIEEKYDDIFDKFINESLLADLTH